MIAKPVSLCRLAAIAGLVGLITTCGSAGAAPPGSQAPSSASTSSIAAAGLGFSCSLPVARFDYGAGFVQFPKGAYKSDGSAGFAKTMTYEPLSHRWLPVSSSAIAPNKRSYAVAIGGDLSIVDISSGRRSVIFSAPDIHNVVGYTPAGVYVSRGAWPPDLWLIRADSRTAERVQIEGLSSTDPLSWIVSRGALWARSSTAGAVMRIDLEGHTSANWLAIPNSILYILGFDDSGRPIVWIDDQGKVLVLTGPATSTTVASSMGSPGFRPISALGDWHGLWFGNGVHDGSIWLYQPARGLRKAAEIPPAASSGTADRSSRIAGPCT